MFVYFDELDILFTLSLLWVFAPLGRLDFVEFLSRFISSLGGWLFGMTVFRWFMVASGE